MKIFLNAFFILSLMLLNRCPMACAEPETYGPFEVRLETAAESFPVGVEPPITIIISHTYPASLPGTFVVELYHKGLKEWEYLTNLDVLLPIDNEFTLKKFGVPAFNKDAASIGEWTIKVYPLRDKAKMQEITVMVTPDPAARLKPDAPKHMNITRAAEAAFELTETLKKRGNLLLSAEMARMLNKNDRWEDAGRLAEYFNALDLSVYPNDIKKKVHDIALAFERAASVNLDDFPIRKGDRYALLVDSERSGVAFKINEQTERFDATIPESTVLVVAKDRTVPGDPEFEMVPEEYDRMETRLVPKDVRNTREYRRYYFPFTVDEIGVVVEKIE